MGRRKKPFINRKSAATFQVVTRSQRDPLINTSAPRNVLLPEHLTRGHPDSLTKEQRLAKQAAYGIHFEDDDYDYLQHLKDADEVEEYELVDERYRIYRLEDNGARGVDAAAAAADKTVIIPSSMLPSQGVQLKVGLLNQPAEQSSPSNVDADLVAALDDDFDFENPDNQLEDDFMQHANAPSRDSSDDGDDEDCDEDLLEEDHCHLDVDDGPSNADVSLSRLSRSTVQKMLDHRLRAIMGQYESNSDDDSQSSDVGEQDGGLISSVANYANRDKLTHDLNEMPKEEDENQVRSELKQKVLCLASTEHTEHVLMEERQMKRPLDCESIISLSSNIYNHPTVIAFPTKRQRRSSGASSTQCPPSLASKRSTTSRCRPNTVVCNVREKGEPTEEKRLRKKLVKAEARERRQQKKTTKLAFKTEELRNKFLELNTLRNLHQIRLN